MGIEDRGYMRKTISFHRGISATAGTIIVLFGFFVLNLIQESAGTNFLGWAALHETAPQFWQWLSHGLLHFDFWHLLFNGLGLWWVGKIVEENYGVSTYFKTLSAGVLIGALTWWLTGLGGPRLDGALIGISAGVYALLIVALLDRLDEQVTILIFFILPVTLRIRWLLWALTLFALGGWLFSELPSRHQWAQWHPAWNSNHIAHSAHLGGLLAGWLIWRYLNQIDFFSGFALYKRSPSSPNPIKSHPKSPSTDHSRAELDRLLDKISAGGFGSLTPEEKSKLEELSARLR
ncbi:MAG: rhomboid family intramembrane serine protease [bacterium]